MIKMNKFIVMGIATIILTFFASITGFFDAFYNYPVTINFIFDYSKISIYLHSTALMLGICLGIISTFVKRKRKRKILFYSSIITIITIILGGIVAKAMWAPWYPLETMNPNGEPGDIFISVLLNNLYVSFVIILSGPTIIYPYIMLGGIVIDDIDLIPRTISFHGFKGVIYWVGAFHIYPELYAIYLACISGIKISLKSFKAYISIRRNGFKSTLKTIKEAMVYELRNTMPKVVILLIIAALLQDFWSTTFWIDYWIQHIK